MNFENEAQLSKYLVSIAPGIERIENSAKGGTPDMLVPTTFGWFPLELKIMHGNRLVFQNTQMAFFVRNRRLPRYLWCGVLAVRHGTEIGTLLNCDQILSMPKQPFAHGKTQVNISDKVTMTELCVLIDKIGCLQAVRHVIY
jgi:hypothetical protein